MATRDRREAQLKEISLITKNFTESVIREMTRICNEHRGLNLAQGPYYVMCENERLMETLGASNDHEFARRLTFLTDHFSQENGVSIC